jgi:hypothetical protein
MIEKHEYYQAVRDLGKYINHGIEKGSPDDLETLRLMAIISSFEKENFKQPVKSDKEALEYILDLLKNNDVIK